MGNCWINVKCLFFFNIFDIFVLGMLFFKIFENYCKKKLLVYYMVKDKKYVFVVVWFMENKRKNILFKNWLLGNILVYKN